MRVDRPSAGQRFAFFAVGLLVTLTIAYVATSEHAIVGERHPGAYTVTCLPDAPQDLSGDTCRTLLGSPRDRRGEGMLAVHPNDPQTIVLAALTAILPKDAAAQGDRAAEQQEEEEAAEQTPQQWVQDRLNETTGAPPEPEPDAPPPGIDCPHYAICLHVTEDGGATWRTRGIPTAEGRPMRPDPTVVFTEDGTLHLAALLQPEGIGHTSSTDLGRTWTTPQIVVDGSVDRPWLQSDGRRLVLSYQDGSASDFPYRTHVIVRHDEGSPWTTSRAYAPMCVLIGPPHHIEGPRWLVPCIQMAPMRIRLHEVDVVADTAREHDTLPGGYNRPFVSGNGDTLVLAHDGRLEWSRDTVHARVSDGAGAHWSRAVDLLAVTHLDDAWRWHWLSGAQRGPDGTLHALIVGGRGADCRAQLCQEPQRDHEVLWVAVDPRSGDLLGEAILDAGPRPGSVRHGMAIDDYHHIVPYGDGVLLAWSHDGQAAIAWVRPT